MESNSVCNHTSDEQNKMTTKRESNLLITSTRHRVYVFMKILILIGDCPITSMTRTLLYKCSNWAGDNQSRSRILL